MLKDKTPIVKFMSHLKTSFDDLFPPARENVVEWTMTMTVHTMLVPEQGAVLSTVRGGRAG